MDFDDTMLRRFFNLAGKTWKVILELLEDPKQIPRLAWFILVKNAYAWDLINLAPFHQWIRSQNIHTIIDVGAHTGEFSSAIGALLPDANLYCFEPLLDCYERLCKRFNNRKNFSAFQVALGNNIGTTSFWRSHFSKASSLLAMDEAHRKNFPWSAEVTQVQVEMDVLDTYIDRIDLTPKVMMKIDVQGAEYQVLQGGLKFLQYVDIVLVETSFEPLYDGQAFFREIHSFFCERGYEYRGNFGQQVSNIDGSILQVDALFIRE